MKTDTNYIYVNRHVDRQMSDYLLQIWGQVKYQINAQVNNQVWNQAYKVRDQVISPVRDQVNNTNRVI